MYSRFLSNSLQAFLLMFSVQLIATGEDLQVDKEFEMIEKALGEHAGFADKDELGFELPEACCVCMTNSDPLVLLADEGLYCSTDLNTWFRQQFTAYKAARSSVFFTFTNNGRDGRRLHVKRSSEPDTQGAVSDYSWRQVLDEDNLITLEKLEAPTSPPLFSSVFSSTLFWLFQSLYALKTWNNALCCCAYCPHTADAECGDPNMGLSCCGLNNLIANPYYERCPHCLIPITRLPGCSHMTCTNPKCKGFYIARQQVQLPLGLAIVGCNNGLCNPQYCYEVGGCSGCIKTAVCFAIGPCESFRCKIQCLPCCVKDPAAKCM